MIAKQTKTSHCLTASEALVAAKLDFVPIKQDLITVDGIAINGYSGLYRSDTKQTLSVMGSDYTAFSSAQTFAIADVFKEKYNLGFKKVISIDNGKRIVIEMEENREFLLGGRDRAKRRLRIVDSFDGSTRFYAQAGVWRMICTNGLFGWRNESIASIRHTSHAEDRLKQAIAIWTKSATAWDQIERNAYALAQKMVDKAMVEKFLDSIVGKVEKDTSTRKKNQRTEIERLFVHGAGNSGRTAWDLVNSVTEYYQHHVNADNPDSRLASSIFGTGNDQQEKAIKLALAL